MDFEVIIQSISSIMVNYIIQVNTSMQNKSNKHTIILVVSVVTLLLLSMMIYVSNTLNQSSKKDSTKNHITSQSSNAEFAKMTESDIKSSEDKVNIISFGETVVHTASIWPNSSINIAPK